MKTVKILLIMIALISFNLDAKAEDNSAKTNTKIELKDARFMLINSAKKELPIESQIEYKEVDFSWKNLSKNSIASGEVLKIGSGSSKPYFIYQDGLEHPSYISHKLN